MASTIQPASSAITKPAQKSHGFHLQIEARRRQGRKSEESSATSNTAHTQVSSSSFFHERKTTTTLKKKKLTLRLPRRRIRHRVVPWRRNRDPTLHYPIVVWHDIHGLESVGRHPPYVPLGQVRGCTRIRNR